MTVRFLKQPSQEAFQLPLAGLFADLEVGSGSVRFTDDFNECEVVNQLRIVQDWQRDLSELRRQALTGIFGSRFASLEIPHEEQVARFSRYCVRLGLGCPEDLLLEEHGPF